MAKSQRTKGARIERLIVEMHQDAGIPCEKVSRSGYTGEDLSIADAFTGEVKGRKSPLKTVLNWLGDNDFLFIKPDYRTPLVFMTWDSYVELMRSYKGTNNHV